MQIPAAGLKQAVMDAYNPNNSIGAINTDISILWAEKMPERVFSLKNPDGPVVIGGVGSLLVATIWMGLFPDLRRVDRFEPADEKKADA